MPWTYNPFTGKLDYYAMGGTSAPVVLYNLLQEDGISKLILEDASGKLALES